ncbi:MAG: ABC transporter permease [Bacillota bacterium]|nr:ABC transporter permease [Bacillota bacterium]
MSKNVLNEPFIRIEKRDGMSSTKSIAIRIIAVILALLVDALFIFFITKLNPVEVYKTMFTGTFDFSFGIRMFETKLLRTLRDVALLLGIAIALAPAFKMRFWNIGAEGQVLVGALASAICMQAFGSKISNPLLFAAMIVTSILAGALWGFIPAFFKAKWNTNETLFTLMMNYVAINIVTCMTNIWRGEKSSMGTINAGTRAGWFPMIMGQRFTLNIIIVLILTIAIFVYLKYSKHGYEIAVVGESENTARYAGINVAKVIMRTMAISGAICGICGFMTVAGKDQTISATSAGGYGFTAIIVAWMSKFNTFFMMIIAFLIVFLEHGASEIASNYSIMNDYAADIISGIILFFLIGCEFFVNYKIKFRDFSDKGGK